MSETEEAREHPTSSLVSNTAPEGFTQQRKFMLGLVSLMCAVIAIQSCIWFIDTLKWSGTTTLYLPFDWNLTLTNYTLGNVFYYMIDGCLVWVVVSAYFLGQFKILKR